MSINSKSCRSDAVVRTGIAARLAEIKERADNAANGPWRWTNETRQKLLDGQGEEVLRCTALLWPEPPDAEFIAHARIDVPALTNGLESVLDYVGRCEESGITMQPGDIRRLIAAALGGAS